MSSLRYRYQTIEFDDTDIHVKTLRDRQQFSDDEGFAAKLGISSATWPLFGVIWPSGEALARLMFSYEIQGKRILEVGCGVGLASLVLNHRRADITATDHHPAVEALLSGNTVLNEDRKIPFVRTDWSDPITELGEFDLIIGSDVLYESGHAEQLAGFIDNHARLQCDVIIVDPGRRHKGRFRNQMAQRGYSSLEDPSSVQDKLAERFSVQIMSYHK
jgi:predicted nicotinamide N-methyase